jgi:hypothetical protein
VAKEINDYYVILIYPPLNIPTMGPHTGFDTMFDKKGISTQVEHLKKYLTQIDQRLVDKNYVVKNAKEGKNPQR